MTTAEPVRRTMEIEEVTNLYVIHPISSFLTPIFAALKIHPNTVSIAGMLFGVLAGVAYEHYQNPVWAVVGFALMIAWHVMDGADGQLARLTNAQSEMGKVLDGICDYVTFIAVYSGLAIALSRTYGAQVWILVAVAGLCHAVQAAAYEVQRQEYNFWGLGRKSAELMRMTAEAGSEAPALAGWLHRAYIRVQLAAAGVTLEFHQRLAGALEAEPARADAIRQHYRESFAPSVRRWAVMSANYRTIGIFLCAVAGAPIVYFWFEAIGFSAILVVLLQRRHARYARFFDSLATAA
jgi:phosphatidylglycerophosphate synthase